MMHPRRGGFHSRSAHRSIARPSPFKRLVFSEESLDVVDERDRGLFDGCSQSVWVVEVEICSKVALDDRVNTTRWR